MKGFLRSRRFGSTTRRIAVPAIVLALAGCLGSESEEDDDTTFAGYKIRDISISGSVGDGPLANADIRIVSVKGDVLAELESDVNGDYSIDLLKISADKYPLIITATGGTDIVTDTSPDFTLRGVVRIHQDKATANVNPFTTLAFEIASSMNGGLNRDNIRVAEDIAVSAMNSGLTTLVEPGPQASPINETNVAEIIKASETLAEIVRRTRDRLNDASWSSSGDQVIAALGADLVDDVLDGLGGTRTDPRTSAVALVVSAQVLLESMANELHVNGVDASDAMRLAIEQVSPAKADPGLDDLPITREMIAQAGIGLSAAFAVSGETRISNLAQVTSRLDEGTPANFVRSLLPDDYRGALNNAISKLAVGDDSMVETVNVIAAGSDNDGPDSNRAPRIFGTPDRTARPGSAWEFLPNSSDPDGDPITFRVENKPSWTQFDSKTGRIWGTPNDSHSGAYAGIIIEADDGKEQSRLGPFTVTVTRDNTAPEISGIPSRSIAVYSTYLFKPQASDADGDPLAFSVSNLPAWASFDKSNGTLSGTPEPQDIGMYPGIAISVSDGTDRASLQAFSIDVTETPTGSASATIVWTPPTENEDGTPLTDLAGFRVYWGRESGVHTNSQAVESAGATSAVIENLTPESYEFVVTAYNASGTESRFSKAVRKNAQ